MKRSDAKSGQAALEYVLVFLALFGLYFVLRSFFVPAARNASERTTVLVTSDYP
ncbi:MAG: hypothetical protein ACI4Q3_02675 [Kiritimatiellia bacterium]